jgi:hypothetical protein
MRLRTISFTLAALALAGSLLITSHITDISLWLNRSWFHGLAVTDNRETVTRDHYIFGQTDPLELGEVADANGAYVNLSLRFKMSETAGYHDIFQTSDVNQGLRIEFSGTSGAIVIGSKVAPEGIMAIPLETVFEPGRTYALEVEAINGGVVRVFVDGHRVAYYPANTIKFDSSRILIGTGFSDERRFVGEIDRIRLVKGNFRLSGRGYGMIYGVDALLIFLCAVFIAIAAGKNSALRPIVMRMAVFALPVIAILAHYESRLSSVDSMYYVKRVNLDDQEDRIETLVLGSSNAVYGISPEKLTRPAYNLAFLGNEIYVDMRLVETYAPRMKNLKTVVFNLNYFTTSLGYSKFSQDWRQFFIRQFYGVESSVTAGLRGSLLYWPDPRNFSKIAVFGELAPSFAGPQHTAPFDIVVNKSGWYDSGSGSVDSESGEKQGAEAAKYQNSTYNVVQVKENLIYLSQAIDFLQRMNVQVEIVYLPTPQEYYSKLDVANFEEQIALVSALAREKNVKLLNYTRDPRFTLTDFAIGLVDHLNATGAERFSKIFDQDLR